MDERKRHQIGMEVRRSVLGEVWSRPGLPRHTRSLLTIGLMLALNRGEELRLHLRAAATNGVTAEEIREVLLHCAIYCGVPAANAAFQAAKEILNEHEQSQAK